MKITMYELLGMVKDGKAPKKIEYCGYVFEYDTNHLRYETFNFDEQKYETLNEHVDINYDLNDEVEILEEGKKIPEKLDKRDFLDNETLDQVDADLDFIIDKINEIIDYLKSKGDE